MVAEKKTSKEKNDVENKKAVSKKNTKSQVVSNDALKNDVKKDTSKTKKVSKTKAVVADVKTEIKPSSENVNYNPVDEVLQIKAKNDEKAKVKTKAKVVKETTKKEDTLPKKINTITKTNKRDEVKENALKAEAKKFKQLKEEAQKEECSRLSAFSSFVDAYKKIFTYKGRASRYDYWSFMLLNLVFCLVFFFTLVAFSKQLSTLALGSVFIVFVLVQMFVYLSLIVRRLHDTGNNAWKGFFAPMSYTALTYLLVSIAIKLLEEGNMILLLCLSILNFILALVNSYYLIKTYIVASFIEEDKNANEFGLYKGSDVNKVIRFASLYFILTFVFVALINIAFLSYTMPYMH
jgi:uncharacterized membrane protein YhaH (DUF805 family)